MYSIRQIKRLNLRNKNPLIAIISIALVAILFPSMLRLKRYYMVNDVNTYHPNVPAFLMMLRWCEGTDDANGYRALFGHRKNNPRLFHSFADHPRQYFSFKQTNGKRDKTSAAGAYQFLDDTWDRLVSKLSLPDFSPSSQDRGAIELIAEKGAIKDIQSGKIQTAIHKVRKIWASLPNAGYAQKTRSLSDALTKYKQYGGQLS